MLDSPPSVTIPPDILQQIALLLSAQNITIPPVPVPNNPNVPITATGNSPAISIAADESGDLLRITPNNLITDDKSSDSNVVPGATPEITNTSINDPNSINNLVSIKGLFADNDHSQDLQADPKLDDHGEWRASGNGEQCYEFPYSRF
ncbi:hypothetical protein PSTG_14229 [Puccinia striiformis f. sp. tritici PST-78]|uniref:Uncharacterized protein n=1 Tax=Puccinia striiformis f. sp. tritici PST-78 TaxID=1165861 RepID=A0A0L0UZB9_9BASI|nr:hypothetical protein PSTG_14229 [Puccinia striiformis f. sp. tritici PST-78]